jgi:hypothetical protein
MSAPEESSTRRVTEPEREIPVAAEVDVLVAGGGSAGWHAAVSAARAGAKTLLVERHGTLGGTVTNAMVQPFMNYHDPVGNAVVGGIWQEMVDRLQELGASPGSVDASTGKAPWGKKPTLTPFEPEAVRYVAQELVLTSGADLLLHTMVVDAIVNDGRLDGLIVENKSGRQAILAKCVVDATGDADVAALAGAPFVKGRERDGLSMPMSLYIKMADVDYSAIATYLEANPDEFRWWAYPDVSPDSPAQFERNPVSVSGFISLVKKARDSGELYLGRETINILPCPLKGEAVLNCTRVGHLDPTNAWDLTTAEIEARRQAMSVVSFVQNRLPGFENSKLVSIAPTIGVRESRRIVGEHILTVEEVIDGPDFEDAIARSAYNVDIHNPDDDKSTWYTIKDSYGIPYRTLVPLKIDNLLVAGRCISATHEAGGSARMTPNVAATGEAAGIAAAMTASTGVVPRSIDTQKLREQLIAAGAILERPAASK